MPATLFCTGKSISVFNSQLFGLKCVCNFFDCNEGISVDILIFVIYTYHTTTYLYLHSLGTNHTLEETLYTLFLCAWVELYSFLYTLEGTYTPLLYTLGGSFRPVCGTPMRVCCTPHFNCVATAQLMLALIKGVVDVGVVFVHQTHSEKLATMLIIQT